MKIEHPALRRDLRPSLRSGRRDLNPGPLVPETRHPPLNRVA